MDANEPRQTIAPTELAHSSPRARRSFSPTRIFVDKDRTALFWFCIAVAATAFALIQPHLLLQGWKQRERVIILDPAGTFFVSPVMDFQDADKLHATQTTLATIAFLERNPNNFDHPELLKFMYLKQAHGKAVDQRATEAEEFKVKQLHQKVEIAKIDILQTREDAVLTQATGQLIRSGIFEGKAFSESIPFKITYKMARNPDMTQNGRFPTAVSDFKYEPQS